MEHQAAASPEVSFQHHNTDEEFKKRVRKTTILLSVVTIIELIIGLTIYSINKGDNPSSFLILAFKGAVCILTLAKAYYIVSVFMHLGDEIRNLVMTIIAPLMLFIWFIAAFLMDGASYRTMRNRHDPYYKQTTLDRETKKGDTTTVPLN
ncbi:MAG TPA: cytochrome C oxidase subunit IV family protein [Flavisolibacter sp.]|jgi:uncharacterized membrane protein|nr:cytochrome C oxidase subunit IV family protein [Flavisolibacter sp.]